MNDSFEEGPKKYCKHVRLQMNVKQAEKTLNELCCNFAVCCYEYCYLKSGNNVNVCLCCGLIVCDDQHARQHSKFNKKHNVFFNIDADSIWCAECMHFVKTPKNRQKIVASVRNFFSKEKVKKSAWQLRKERQFDAMLDGAEYDHPPPPEQVPEEP